MYDALFLEVQEAASDADRELLDDFAVAQLLRLGPQDTVEAIVLDHFYLLVAIGSLLRESEQCLFQIPVVELVDGRLDRDALYQGLARRVEVLIDEPDVLLRIDHMQQWVEIVPFGLDIVIFLQE